MMPATLLYAGLLGLLAVLLANQVLYVRVRGARQPAWKHNAVLRVQANFNENVPLALLLLYLVEMSGAGAAAVHIFGVALVLFRILHAWGMSRTEGANYPRLIGAQGTFLLISIMSVTAVYRALGG
ncbi:MAG: MAPEG family protein [Halioglobus sp.]|nr:MAPEG family protein [Halioglobus sp.]